MNSSDTLTNLSDFHSSEFICNVYFAQPQGGSPSGAQTAISDQVPVFMRKAFKYLSHFTVEKWLKMQIHIHIS